MTSLSVFLRDELGGYERMWAEAGQHRYDRHAHDEYSVIVVTEGQKTFRVGTTEHSVQPGQVILVAPGESHECEPLRDTDWAHCCWYIQPQFLSALFRNDSFSKQPRFGSTVIDSPGLARTLSNTHRRARTGDAYEPLREMDALEAVINLTAEVAGAKPLRPNTPQERRSALYEEALIEEHTEALDLDLLSALGNVSKHQVIRDMTKVRGMPPGRLLRDIRLRKSKTLLRNGESITEIGHMLRFADQSHFTRCFRKAYGITPGKYQSQFRRS